MIVNKQLLYILFFFISIIAVGQPPVQGDPPAIETFIENADIDSNTFQDRNFEPGFQEKYKAKEFVYERKAAGKSQWERFIEWLSKLLDDIFTFGEETQSTPLYVIIIRVTAILVILSVIYFIVRALLNKEGVWIFGRSRKGIHIEDAVVENIHEMDFRQLISDTRNTANYRPAVRYYYLWLLKKLSAREIIDWHWDKTNSDYLYEIKDAGLKRDFEYLSYLYDYSWYGEFTIDETAFGKAEKAFQKTINTL